MKMPLPKAGDMSRNWDQNSQPNNGFAVTSGVSVSNGIIHTIEGNSNNESSVPTGSAMAIFIGFAAPRYPIKPVASFGLSTLLRNS